MQLLFIKINLCAILYKRCCMHKYKCNDEDCKKFALDLYMKLRKDISPVFLCVGSDKFVCDSMAPMVGEMLTKKYNINAYVYGSLDYNINGNNLVTAVNYIESNHPYSQIILVDATLGGDVGSVQLTSGTFAGMGKILPIKKIGTFSILGVVGEKTKPFNLNTTSLNVVYTISKFIAKGIAMAMSQTKYNIPISSFAKKYY